MHNSQQRHFEDDEDNEKNLLNMQQVFFCRHYYDLIQSDVINVDMAEFHGGKYPYE